MVEHVSRLRRPIPLPTTDPRPALTSKTTPLVAAPSAPGPPPLLTSDEIIELSRLDAVVNLQRWWKRRRHHNYHRIAELQEALRLYAQSLIDKRRQARVRSKIRDLLLHMAFLYAYTVSCHRHGYMRERLFGLTQATTSAFQAQGFVVPSTTTVKYFSDIGSREDLHAWLRGPFLSTAYQATSSSFNSIARTNLLVGGIRIGQIRVKRTNCTNRVSVYFSSATPSADTTPIYCYGDDTGDFTESDESIGAFGGDTGDAFPFLGLNGTDATRERRETFSSMRTVSAETLPAPAFSVVLPQRNSSQASDILEWLEHASYVDAATRAVMVDVNLFNAMLRYVLVLRFLVEFPAGGGATPSIEVTLAPLTKSFLIDLDDIGGMVVNFVVLAFYVYFLVSEIIAHATRRKRKKAISAMSKGLRWSTRNGSELRIISLLMFFLVWLMRLFTLLKLPSEFPLADSSEYVRLRPFANAFTVSQYLLGVNTCLCWWILLLLLRMIHHVDLFIRTLLVARSRLFILLVCLAVLLYGYACAFLVAIGPQSSRYRSISVAMSSLMLTLFGSLNSEVSYSQSTIQLLLFACFLVLNVFVVANLFLVVIHDAYRFASEEMMRIQHANEQFNLPTLSHRKGHTSEVHLR